MFALSVKTGRDIIVLELGKFHLILTTRRCLQKTIVCEKCFYAVEKQLKKRNGNRNLKAKTPSPKAPISRHGLAVMRAVYPSFKMGFIHGRILSCVAILSGPLSLQNIVTFQSCPGGCDTRSAPEAVTQDR